MAACRGRTVARRRGRRGPATVAAGDGRPSRPGVQRPATANRRGRCWVSWPVARTPSRVRRTEVW